jgi:hypothetical protein
VLLLIIWEDLVIISPWLFIIIIIIIGLDDRCFSISCFLKDGKMISLMAAIGGFNSVDEMYRNGVPRAALDRVESTLKSRRFV